MDDRRQPRRNRGVMEYVAELQQFDTAAPWAPAPTDEPGPEPTDRYSALADLDPHADAAGPEPTDRYAALADLDPGADVADLDPHADVADLDPGADGLDPGADVADLAPPPIRPVTPQPARGVAQVRSSERDIVAPEVYELPSQPPEQGPAGVGERRQLLPVADAGSGSAVAPDPQGRLGSAADRGGSPAETVVGPRVIAVAGHGDSADEHRPTRRRLRLVMASGVALAALAAGGLGYMALRRSDSAPVALAPDTPGASLPPVDGRTPDAILPPVDGRSPGLLPGVPGSPAPAAPSGSTGSATADGTAATTTAAGTGPSSGGATRGGTSGGGVPTGAGTSGAQRPTQAASESTTEPTAPPALVPRPVAPPDDVAPSLTATYDSLGGRGDDGIIGYTAKITIVNPGDRDIARWQVTLTVPGGNPVYTDGPVTVDQSGEWVTFSPSGWDGAVPAGGSLTFTFRVRGLLTEAPSGCAVDGEPCA